MIPKRIISVVMGVFRLSLTLTRVSFMSCVSFRAFPNGVLIVQRLGESLSSQRHDGRGNCDKRREEANNDRKNVRAPRERERETEKEEAIENRREQDIEGDAE